jgi:hypothetical protein
MSPGITFHELYGATFGFCLYEIAITNTKWWQFTKRRQLRTNQSLYYPIMVNELKMLNNLTRNE